MIASKTRYLSKLLQGIRLIELKRLRADSSKACQQGALYAALTSRWRPVDDRLSVPSWPIIFRELLQ
jgi:hypothetical protein